MALMKASEFLPSRPGTKQLRSGGWSSNKSAASANKSSPTSSRIIRMRRLECADVADKKTPGPIGRGFCMSYLRQTDEARCLGSRVHDYPSLEYQPGHVYGQPYRSGLHRQRLGIRRIARHADAQHAPVRRPRRLRQAGGRNDNQPRSRHQSRLKRKPSPQGGGGSLSPLLPKRVGLLTMHEYLCNCPHD